MTDRELLEAAAKAAGIPFPKWNSAHGYMMTGIGSDTREWNPLADDGDALRLAVRIGEPFVVRTRCVTTVGGLKEDFDPAVEGDDIRAARRAIVRAAAAMAAKEPR